MSGECSLQTYSHTDKAPLSQMLFARARRRWYVALLISKPQGVALHLPRQFLALAASTLQIPSRLRAVIEFLIRYPTNQYSNYIFIQTVSTIIAISSISQKYTWRTRTYPSNSGGITGDLFPSISYTPLLSGAATSLFFSKTSVVLLDGSDFPFWLTCCFLLRR